MSQKISLVEALLVLGVVVCIIIKYAPELEGRHPANCGNSYSCHHINPKYENLGDFPIKP